MRRTEFDYSARCGFYLPNRISTSHGRRCSAVSHLEAVFRLEFARCSEVAEQLARFPTCVRPATVRRLFQTVDHPHQRARSAMAQADNSSRKATGRQRKLTGGRPKVTPFLRKPTRICRKLTLFAQADRVLALDSVTPGPCLWALRREAACRPPRIRRWLSAESRFRARAPSLLRPLRFDLRLRQEFVAQFALVELAVRLAR